MSEEKNIETYLDQLRQINEQMTAEGIKMEDALNLYRQGVTLVQEAEKLLQTYEQEVASIEAST